MEDAKFIKDFKANEFLKFEVYGELRFAQILPKHGEDWIILDLFDLRRKMIEENGFCYCLHAESTCENVVVFFSATKEEARNFISDRARVLGQKYYLVEQDYKRIEDEFYDYARIRHMKAELKPAGINPEEAHEDGCRRARS